MGGTHRHRSSHFNCTSVIPLQESHCYSSGLVIQGFIKGSILQWEDPEYTVFDSQSTNQIIAEIDFEVNSDSLLSISSKERDSNQEANPAQCAKTPLRLCQRG